MSPTGTSAPVGQSTPMVVVPEPFFGDADPDLRRFAGV